MKDLTAVIIDDDQDFTPILSESLTLQKIKIVGIGYTGTDAIRLVKANKPDIVFLDVKTSKLNGVEAINEIKKQYPEIRIIIVASEQNENLEKLSKYSADTIIFKNFNLQKIAQSIENIKTSIA